MSVYEHIERNAFVSLRNVAPGRHIVCEQGALWITYGVEAVDILLEPGQTHVLRHRGAALQALARSRVVIAPAAAAPHPYHRWFWLRHRQANPRAAI